MDLKKLTLTILMSLMTLSTFPQVANSWAGGTGTKEDPYQISDISQLRKLAEDVNRGISYKNKYFVLTADIRDNEDVLLSDGTLTLEWSRLKEWVAIGASEGTPFRGNFDGRNHSISGLCRIRDLSNYDEDTSNPGPCDLFFHINEANISNIRLKDSYLWSMIGVATSSVIDNCITFSTSVAGIVNRSNKSTIKNCGNYGLSYYAGIIQWGDKTDVINCYNYGKIVRKAWSGGGIADKVTSCYNCMNMGEIKGFDICAGIVRWASPESRDEVVIANVVNYGNVSPFDYKSAAGIAVSGNTNGLRGIVQNTYMLETSNIRLFGNNFSGIRKGDNLKMTEDEMKSQDFLDKLNANAKNLKSGCCGWKFGKDGYPILEIIDENENASVNGIFDDNDLGESTGVVYYNCQGIKVPAPTKGLFIKIEGKKVTKIIK